MDIQRIDIFALLSRKTTISALTGPYRAQTSKRAIEGQNLPNLHERSFINLYKYIRGKLYPRTALRLKELVWISH
jgi:hypothetical protein